MRITKLIGISIVVLVASAIANAALLFPDMRALFRLAEEREAAKPPTFSVVTVSAENCPTCFNPSALVATLRQGGVEIVEERTVSENDEEGKQLLLQYTPERLPLFVMKGDFTKDEQLKIQLATLGTVTDDTFVWTKMRAPYKERATGNARGAFSVTYVTDSTCATCYDVMNHSKALATVGMTTEDDRVVDIRSVEGRTLQKKYAITAVPMILLTGDMAAYDNFRPIWDTVGTVETDGTYVFREQGIVSAQMGTYRNMKTGKIVTPAPPSVGNGT